MPYPELNNETELLSKIANGDELAFEQLFHAYRKKIYTIALKISQSPENAEEILQDIFLIVWLNRGSLAEVRNFSAYLYTITKNETFHALKRIARSKNALKDIILDKNNADNSTEDKVLERNYEQLLHNALNELPHQQKLVYQLIKQQGLSRSEAAAQLNLHPETVKTHLAQAMKSIRAFCLSNLSVLIIMLFQTFF